MLCQGNEVLGFFYVVGTKSVKGTRYFVQRTRYFVEGTRYFVKGKTYYVIISWERDITLLYREKEVCRGNDILCRGHNRINQSEYNL